jgi:hypothetical protein
MLNTNIKMDAAFNNLQNYVVNFDNKIVDTKRRIEKGFDITNKIMINYYNIANSGNLQFYGRIINDIIILEMI